MCRASFHLLFSVTLGERTTKNHQNIILAKEISRLLTKIFRWNLHSRRHRKGLPKFAADV